jgi:selenocysteine lyase/cysteine desulfurase
VNVKQLGCDAYASSGHKFLLGPKGTGLLYISEQARDQIKPMQLDDGYGFYTAIRGTSFAALHSFLSADSRFDRHGAREIARECL